MVEDLAVAEHAGVVLGFEFGFHAGEEGGFAFGLDGVGGEVVDALDVAGEVVEFFGGSEAEVELPEFVSAVLAAAFEDE